MGKELRERADDASRLERSLQDALKKSQTTQATLERLRAELAEYKQSSKDVDERNKALTKHLIATTETIEKLRLQIIELKAQVELNDPVKLKELIEHLAARLDDARTVARQQKEVNNLLY